TGFPRQVRDLIYALEKENEARADVGTSGPDAPEHLAKKLKKAERKTNAAFGAWDPEDGVDSSEWDVLRHAVGRWRLMRHHDGRHGPKVLMGTKSVNFYEWRRHRGVREGGRKWTLVVLDRLREVRWREIEASMAALKNALDRLRPVPAGEVRPREDQENPQ